MTALTWQENSLIHYQPNSHLKLTHLNFVSLIFGICKIKNDTCKNVDARIGLPIFATLKKSVSNHCKTKLIRYNITHKMIAVDNTKRHCTKLHCEFVGFSHKHILINHCCLRCQFWSGRIKVDGLSYSALHCYPYYSQ